ncbi:hypothetical protein PENTCL1PPCAC_18152, partial [Pristionchus entomophagus]
GKCTCACEPAYTGEHCETLLPCSAFPCHNEGICKDDYDETAGTYTAKCKCPIQSILWLKGTMKIEGEHCEILTSIDAMDLVNPCGTVEEFLTALRNFDEEYKVESSMQSKIFHEEIEELLCGSNGMGCPPLERDKNICSGLSDSCSVAAGPVGPSKVLFPLPRCTCPGLRYGKHCQFELETLCDVTREEIKANITKESRCTSYANGACDINGYGERYCLCKRGWTGEKCEIYAPCDNYPCGKNAECIPIPFELSSPGKESYRCICDVGDEQKKIVERDGTIEDKCIYNGE